jgi:uncharacterized protein (TIGR02599 family)
MRQAFTLVEILVSMALVIILLLILVSVVNQTSSVLHYTTSKIEQFRDARNGFESLTLRLSQATLNTYWDYQRDGSGNLLTSSTDNYTRQSELRFISGPAQGAQGTLTLGLTGTNPSHAVFFQAPLGFVDSGTSGYQSGSNQLENLLNTTGYFIEWADDSNLPPHIQQYRQSKGITRYRYRLMEMIEPSSNLALYQYTSGTNSSGAPNSAAYAGKDWYINSLSTRSVHVLAENVIAMVILPKLSPDDQASGNYNDGSLASNYFYDSTTVNADPNLNRKFGNITTDPGLTSGLFQSVGSTTDPTKPGYAYDLRTLQNKLQSLHLNYRVFTTNVSIKSARWSRSQKN